MVGLSGSIFSLKIRTYDFYLLYLFLLLTCARLAHEWQAFVSRTHKLRKTFVSVKGIYYQVPIVATVMVIN